MYDTNCLFFLFRYVEMSFNSKYTFNIGNFMKFSDSDYNPSLGNVLTQNELFIIENYVK